MYDFTKDAQELRETAERLQGCATLMQDLRAPQAPHIRREHYLQNTARLGLSTEGISDENPVERQTMFTELSQESLASGVKLLSRLKFINSRFGPEFRAKFGIVRDVYDMIQTTKQAAAEAARARAAEATAHTADAALHGIGATHDIAQKALANGKQIKMILAAMTAAMAFVGFALTSLVSAIKQKEGIPTFSEKLSAKLRSIRWPFGDFGLSKSTDSSLGLLTVDGNEATTPMEDARSDLIHSTPLGVSDLNGLPDTAPTDPFGEQQFNTTSNSLLDVVKAHPILSIVGVIGMVIGVYHLCSKLISYVIRGGAKIVENSLGALKGSLKVRPLK